MCISHRMPATTRKPWSAPKRKAAGSNIRWIPKRVYLVAIQMRGVVEGLSLVPGGGGGGGGGGGWGHSGAEGAHLRYQN